MADHPILFSAPMIRALLREIEAPGTGKTQTRRAIPEAMQDAYSGYDDWCSNISAGVPTSRQWEPEFYHERIRIRPGDRLWCREEHYQFGHWEVATGKLTKGGREKWQFVPDSDEVRTDAPSEFRGGRHRQDPFTPSWHKRLGRFMFRRHSRLTLYVTEVRVQRLQEISEADAIAEGILHQNVILDVKCYGGQPVYITADRYWNGTEPDEFEGFESAS